MRFTEDKKIVIGASGYLGSRFCDYFRALGIEVHGFCYKSKDFGIDLAQPNFGLLSEAAGRSKFLLMLAGVSRLAKCEQFEEETFKINVWGVKEVFSWCAENGIKPVYFSTDCVFDGYEAVA